MIKTVKHAEIGGKNTMKNKIIIDTCKFSENEFETMSLCGDDELDCIESNTERDAIESFNTLVNKYAGEFQKVIYNANLVAGKRYTLVYCDEFGFPVAQKITFTSMDFSTYAQHSDVVKMVFKPFRKRSEYQKYFYNTSILIFEGWQDLKDTDTKKIVSSDEKSTTYILKYSCFDSRYIDDIEQIFTNQVLSYKYYETGKNGKMYA